MNKVSTSAKQKQVNIANVNHTSPIFVKKDGKLVGMVILLNGTIHLHFHSGDTVIKSAPFDTRKELIDHYTTKLGYEFFIEE